MRISTLVKVYILGFVIYMGYCIFTDVHRISERAQKYASLKK
jgi:hypothetical protein